MKCIYCNEEKDGNEFSLEHIFPSALGGKSIDNPLFRTRQVCKRCNSLAGLYVDSAFVKNFFATMLVPFSKYIGYYDFEKNPYIPFAYMGFVEYIKHPNFEFCDKWLWSGGSMVYHFHNNSSKDFNTIAGGDPRKRKNKDAGEVYLIGFTDNPFWITLLMKAYTKQFKKSKKFFVNYILPEELKEKRPQMNEIQKDICKKIYKLHETKEEQKHTLAIQVNFNVRFQAKLALGLGHSLFGEDYTQSLEAKKIRDIFWNKDYKELKILQPEMLQFFSEEKENFQKITRYISFTGCHGLYFLRMNNSLIFYADLYGEGSYPILTVVAKDISVYKHELIEKYPKGWGYILVPQRNLFIGEFDIGALLAYNTGDKSHLPELVELEKLYKSQEELPPFNLRKEGTIDTI